jgi:hypothetical protein
VNEFMSLLLFTICLTLRILFFSLLILSEPWFNYECQLARKNLRKRRRKFKNNRTSANHEEMKVFAKKYKKTLDKNSLTLRILFFSLLSLSDSMFVLNSSYFSLSHLFLFFFFNNYILVCDIICITNIESDKLNKLKNKILRVKHVVKSKSDINSHTDDLCQIFILAFENYFWN